MLNCLSSNVLFTKDILIRHGGTSLVSQFRRKSCQYFFIYILILFIWGWYLTYKIIAPPGQFSVFHRVKDPDRLHQSVGTDRIALSRYLLYRFRTLQRSKYDPCLLLMQCYVIILLTLNRVYIASLYI